MKFNKEFFDGLEDDLEIHEMRLDKDWINQPSLYMKYAAASAHFKKLASEADAKTKIAEAELKAEAAEDPDKCLGKGVKPSGEKIAAYAASHPLYAEAKQKAIDASYLADLAMSTVFAMQQKKEALENLVRLQNMEYYSAPRGSGNSDFENRSVHGVAAEKIAERARRRRQE